MHIGWLLILLGTPKMVLIIESITLVKIIQFSNSFCESWGANVTLTKRYVMLITLDYDSKCRLINNKSHYKEALESVSESEAKYLTKVLEYRDRLQCLSLFPSPEFVPSTKTEMNLFHNYITYLNVYHDVIEQRKMLENKIKFYDEILNSNQVDTEKSY